MVKYSTQLLSFLGYTVLARQNRSQIISHFSLHFYFQKILTFGLLLLFPTYFLLFPTCFLLSNLFPYFQPISLFPTYFLTSEYSVLSTTPILYTFEDYFMINIFISSYLHIFEDYFMINLYIFISSYLHIFEDYFIINLHIFISSYLRRLFHD